VSVLFHCHDQWGQIITLDDDRWTNHILINHPELAGQEEALAVALLDPAIVTQDGRHGNGRNYYAFGVLAPPLDRVYLKVCVRFTVVASSPVANGGVITAYPISSVKRTEVQLWP